MAKEEKKEEPYEVSISGLLTCGNIASKKDTDALDKSLSHLEDRVKSLEKMLKEQGRSINIIHTRLERLERFLKSFK